MTPPDGTLVLFDHCKLQTLLFVHRNTLLVLLSHAHTSPPHLPLSLSKETASHAAPPLIFKRHPCAGRHTGGTADPPPHHPVAPRCKEEVGGREGKAEQSKPVKSKGSCSIVHTIRPCSHSREECAAHPTHPAHSLTKGDLSKVLHT